jgi:type I restriction enzyme, S subunit
MARDWQEVPMGRLVELKTGKLDSNQAVENGKYPFFTCAPNPLSINSHAFDCDAILLAGNNANGVFHVNRYSGRFNVYQRTYVITNKDVKILDIGFLFYTLKTLAQMLGHYSQGTATKFLTMKILSALPLRLPPLPIQRRIAAILGALDDKIELNRQMNDTLEQMAQAIFKSWFIDFDGQDDLVDSELGPVPRGWKIGCIGDIAEVTIGGDWGKDESFPNSTPVYCLRGVDLEHLRTSGQAKPPVRWVKKNSIEKRILTDRDVLIAASGAGPCGRPLWASDNIKNIFSNPVLYSNFVKRLRTSSTDYAVFLDRVLFSMRESREIWDFINGTSVPNLDINGLLSGKKIVIPPKEKLRDYYDIVRPFYAKLYNQESRTLAELRDTLLPKLISGELDVSELDIEIPDDIQEQVDKTKGTTDTTVTVPDGGGASDDDESEEVADDAEKVSSAERPAPIDEWDTNDVMVVFRKVAREVGTVYRHEFVKAASRAMGYKRTGDKINNKLRNHMRTAVRRKILAAEDQSVWLATPTMADYERDDLVDAVYAVMPLGRVLERAEVLDTVAYHLGFSRLTETVVTPIKSAIRHLVRVGALQVDGSTLERVWYKE